MGGRLNQFRTIPNTDWTLIERASDAPSGPQQSALHTLLTQYYPALRAYVMSKWRVPPEGAEEYVQEFIATKVVGENLIAQAQQDRGRFRSFLRTTLDAFIVSLIRRETAKKRSPGKIGDLQPELVADDGPTPRKAFEIAWAREVIAAAVAAMERECQQTGRPDLWTLFQTRILLPTIHGSDPVSYQELVAQFGFRSPLQAANALTTAKRMFERNLRSVLSRYSQNERAVDEEILELRAALATGS